MATIKSFPPFTTDISPSRGGVYSSRPLNLGWPMTAGAIAYGRSDTVPVRDLALKKTGSVCFPSLQILALRRSHLEPSHPMVRSPRHMERSPVGSPGNSPRRDPSLWPASTTILCQLLAPSWTPSPAELPDDTSPSHTPIRIA